MSTTTKRSTAKRSAATNKAQPAERSARVELAEAANVITTDKEIRDGEAAIEAADSIGAVVSAATDVANHLRGLAQRGFHQTVAGRCAIGHAVNRLYVMNKEANGDALVTMESRGWADVKPHVTDALKAVWSVEKCRIAWKTYRLQDLRGNFTAEVAEWQSLASDAAMDEEFPPAQRRYFTPDNADSCLFYLDALQDGNVDPITHYVDPDRSNAAGTGDADKAAKRTETKSQRDTRMAAERKEAKRLEDADKARQAEAQREHVKRVTFLTNAGKSDTVANLIKVAALQAASNEQVAELLAYCQSILAQRAAVTGEAEAASVDAAAAVTAEAATA